MDISKNKIKFIRSLQKKKFREIEGMYIIEGRKMVLEAIQHHNALLGDIICTEELKESLPDKWKNRTLNTQKEVIESLSTLTTPQPILATVKKQINQSIRSVPLKDLTIALDNISDPGNMGTIIRLADWFGVKHIVCSENCVDCYNPKVVQATMGGLFRVNVTYGNLPEFLNWVQSENIEIIGTLLEGKNIYHNELPFPAVLVMGNESTGISEDIKSKLSTSVLIPKYSEKNGGSESLNVSTATAIALGEIRRQQFYSK
jgi:TrmH family RNA methyltransferase